MAFIEKIDLQKQIETDMLNAVADNDDTAITNAIDQSVGKARDMLSSQFDVATIFAKTGANRHTVLLAHCVAMAIYNLWRFTDPLGVPALRVDGYKEATDWLKGLVAGKYATELPASTGGDVSGGNILFGSNEERENHY